MGQRKAEQSLVRLERHPQCSCPQSCEGDPVLPCLTSWCRASRRDTRVRQNTGVDTGWATDVPLHHLKRGALRAARFRVSSERLVFRALAIACAPVSVKRFPPKASSMMWQALDCSTGIRVSTSPSPALFLASVPSRQHKSGNGGFGEHPHPPYSTYPLKRTRRRWVLVWRARARLRSQWPLRRSSDVWKVRYVTSFILTFLMQETRKRVSSWVSSFWWDR